MRGELLGHGLGDGPQGSTQSSSFVEQLLPEILDGETSIPAFC